MFANVILFVAVLALGAFPPPAAALSGLTLNSTAIIADNFGSVNLDDVDDRDRIRDEVNKRMVLWADNFVAYLRTGEWRRNLERLVRPQDAASLPSNLITWMEQLTPIGYAGTWGPQEQARLDKIRTAVVIKGLIDFGVPGKARLHEVAGEAGNEALTTYLAESFGGADPAFLARIKEYEDAYQRLFVIKVEGGDGRPAPPADVEGAINALLNRLTAGAANPPPQGDVDSFVDHVASLFVDPTASGWRINPGWWNLTAGNPALQSTAGGFSLVSGAQLLGIKLGDFDPATATADEVIEALSTATKYSVEGKGTTYKPCTGCSGNWSTGDSMTYSLGPLETSTHPDDSIKVIERIGIKSEPLTILVDDHSLEVSGMGAVLPSLPISEELLLLLKLVQAFQQPSVNVPATEPTFSGPPDGSADPLGTFSDSGTVGSSF